MLSKKQIKIFSFLVFKISFLSFSGPVFAFDPFTIVAGASAVTQLLSEVSEEIAEINQGAQQAMELYQEVDGSTDEQQELRLALDELEELMQDAREMGYTVEEMQVLGAKSSKSPEGLIGTMKRATEVAKTFNRVKRLVNRLSGQAQLAQIESKDLQKTALNVQNKQYILALQESEKDLKKSVAWSKQKKNEVVGLEKVLKEKGARKFKNSSALVFPALPDLVESMIKVSLKIRPYLLGLLTFIIFLKIVLSQFSLGKAVDLSFIFSNLLLCTFALSFYPDLIRVCVAQGNQIVSQLSDGKTELLKPESVNLSVIEFFGAKLSHLIQWIHAWIRYLGYSGAQSLSVLGMSILILVLPISIFLSIMLGLQSLFNSCFLAFLSILLWPLIWNALGAASSTLFSSTKNSLEFQLEGILLHFLQILSPLLSFKIIQGGGGLLGSLSRSFSSGRDLSRSLGAQVGSFGRQFFSLSLRGRTTNAGQGGASFLGRTSGMATGWLANQTLSRTYHSVQSFKHSGEGGLKSSAQSFLKNSSLGSQGSFVGGLRPSAPWYLKPQRETPQKYAGRRKFK